MTPRPGNPDATLVCPKDSVSLSLLGGYHSKGVSVTKSQYHALQKLYGYHEEKPDPNWTPPPPPPPPKFGRALPQPEPKNDGHILLQAGADRNLFRQAEADGLRLVAWLARFTETGEDPLKVVIQLAVDAGYDVDPEDYEYALEEGEA